MILKRIGGPKAAGSWLGAGGGPNNARDAGATIRGGLPCSVITPLTPERCGECRYRLQQKWFRRASARRDHVEHGWCGGHGNRSEREARSAAPKKDGSRVVCWTNGQRHSTATTHAAYAAAVGCANRERNRRSRRLLLTTNTELNAIAAPASIGLSNPAAARGRAATL